MSHSYKNRQEFMKANPKARAWAALDDATNQQKKVTPGPVVVKKDSFKNKHAVVIGSGVAGLTTAYELLSQNTGMTVTVLEAHNKTGGRCLSLRTGDTLTEDKNSDLFNSSPGETQTVRFDHPATDSEPYLNAGPGRIPSSHKRLLHYLKKFGVDIEVYIMNSSSNLSQMKEGPFSGYPIVNRRLDHNTRGWLSQMVYQNADTLIDSINKSNGDNTCDEKEKADRVEKLQSLMVTFGNLNSKGNYVVQAAPDGQDDGASDRAGYTELPGVHNGTVAEALGFNDLLDSEFWSKTRIYQPEDFLWQPTLFQPVGGMDHVQHAFAQEVAALGGTIHLNSPVKKIDWNESKQKFVIHVSQMGSTECKEIEADYCFSNAAIPFLSEMLSERLQSGTKGFNKEFKSALNAVYDAQFKSDKTNEYSTKFLACTTKVGWQADRCLWQGAEITYQYNDVIKDEVQVVPDSELGVVPIFGGISWTDDQITQIWYPSTAYHDKRGVLTGCYNFAQNAFLAGKEDIQTRLDKAREGATLFGKAFGDGLENGVAIAWQNMPYIKGGWAQWHTVDDSVEHFNELIQGTGVDGSSPNFFIVGDQVSSLPGWQEGAIASALNALSRLARPDLQLPRLSALPDTRMMVEGI